MPAKPKAPRFYSMELAALSRLLHVAENDARIHKKAVERLNAAISEISGILQQAGAKGAVNE